ncbi:hypothetical protein ONZ45_g4291 [Pleurotus djamor]|nr:hypothetical protein ONZ45_g4291 [Pleurotus djamor]
MIVKHVIQIIIEYIQRPDPEIDFTRCEYLTDTIFEFWILLQRTSFDGCNAEMMMVATYTNGVVAALIEASTKTNNFQFVDKIGGVSVVVPLFLSCIDYYWNEARSQFKREIPVAAFCPLEQALYDMVPFAASSVYNDHIDIPAVFRYSGTVIHWVLSNRPRIIEDLPDGFHNGHTTPIAYLQNYIGFVANTLSHKRYYSLWHDLDLELLKLIRSGLPPEFGEASFAMEEFEYLLEFISFYAQWFPVVLRKALKLLHLPTLPAYQAIWDSFDDDVEPQGRGLENFKVTRKRFSDFPSIFGGDEWPTLIMPLFKRVIEKGKMPGYLVVLSLTMFDDDRLHLLSPYDTVTGAGLLPKVDFDRLLNI